MLLTKNPLKKAVSYSIFGTLMFNTYSFPVALLFSLNTFHYLIILTDILEFFARRPFSFETRKYFLIFRLKSAKVRYSRTI